jgi:hypothetical protein
MSSHSSMVAGGYGSYIREVTRDQCQRLHDTLSYNINDATVIDGLKPNSTTHRSLVLAGTVSRDGACTTGSYSDPLGSWTGVVVLADIHITITSYTTTAKLTDDKIVLKGGVTCRYTEGTCMDFEYGNSFWNIQNLQNCHKHQYIVHYQGVATRFNEMLALNGIMYNKTSYFIESQDKLIWLSAVKPGRICNYDVWHTEHPKILVLENAGFPYLFEPTNIRTADLDLFLYINSKFVAYDKQVGTQMTALYNTLNHQRCMLESQVIQGLISQAFHDPTMFAYEYMKQPGYTGIRRGEIMHIVKCQPVDVSWYSLEQRCYDELPVNVSGMIMFMSPRTRILQRFGTEISCNPVLEGGYKFGENWYAFTPSRHYVEAPHAITVNSNITWKYVEASGLATKGLYSTAELQALSNDLLYHSTRMAISNNMARSALGLNPDHQGLKYSNLLSSAEWEDIGKRVLRRMWGFFSFIGEWVVGGAGIYAFWIFIKQVASVILNGVSLYKVFGLSFKLFGAIWSSLTHFFIIRNIRTQQPQDPLDRVTPTAPTNDEVGRSAHELQPLNPAQCSNPGPTTVSTTVYPKLPGCIDRTV